MEQYASQSEAPFCVWRMKNIFEGVMPEALVKTQLFVEYSCHSSHSRHGSSHGLVSSSKPASSKTPGSEEKRWPSFWRASCTTISAFSIGACATDDVTTRHLELPVLVEQMSGPTYLSVSEWGEGGRGRECGRCECMVSDGGGVRS